MEEVPTGFLMAFLLPFHVAGGAALGVALRRLVQDGLTLSNLASNLFLLATPNQTHLTIQRRSSFSTVPSIRTKNWISSPILLKVGSQRIPTRPAPSFFHATTAGSPYPNYSSSAV